MTTGRPRRNRPQPVTTPPGTRTPIGRDTLRAAWAAHCTDTHNGRLGYRCRTCTHYSAALAQAAVREETHP